MPRLASLPLLVAILSLSFTPASAADIPIVMAVVDDIGNPLANGGPPFVGEKSLWVIIDYYPACSAYEFGIETTFELVEIIPPDGFTNIQNNPLNPYIFPTDPDNFTPDQCAYHACEIIVRDPTGEGGTLCIVPSAERGRACYSPCNAPGWNRPWFYQGYSTIQGQGCAPFVAECGPVSVDATTWSETKATYR